VEANIMNDSITIAVLAGLGGMIGWGTADFFAKKTIDKIGDITSLFWGQLLGVIPLLVIFVATQRQFPELSQREPLYLLLLGVFSALSYIPTYIAFGKGKLSLISPIFASYAAVVALLSVAILHETLSAQQQNAIVLVFVGILLISTNPFDLLKLAKSRSKHKTNGLPEILLAVFMYSFWLIGLELFLNGKDWVSVLLAIRIMSTITLGVYAVATRHKLFFKDKSAWKYLPAIGLFDVGAFAAVTYGFSVTSHVTIITVLAATFSLPAIILARTFLKEKMTPLQTLAALTILLGVALVSAG
jgi:drug/metabolite transporter (DMT)-like permease